MAMWMLLKDGRYFGCFLIHWSSLNPALFVEMNRAYGGFWSRLKAARLSSSLLAT